MSYANENLGDWGPILEAQHIGNNEKETRVFQIARITGLMKPSKIDGEFLFWHIFLLY